MNKNEATYGQLMLGHIEGTLSDAERLTMSQLLEQDASIAREADSLREVHDALALLEFDVPQVDLLARVLDLLDEADADSAGMAPALLQLGDAWRFGVPAVELFEGEPGLVFESELSDMDAMLLGSFDEMPSGLEQVDFTATLAGMLPVEDDDTVEPALEAALFALGGVLARNTQPVDLWSAISSRMGELPKDTAESVVVAEVISRNIVRFPGDSRVSDESPKRVESPRWMRAGMMAAAAALVFVAGYAARDGWLAKDPSSVVANAPGSESSIVPPTNGELQLAGLDPAGDGEGGTVSMRPSPPNGQYPPGPRSKPKDSARPVTLKEVVGTYRLAMKQDADALGQLASWATLTREQAAELLGKAGVSNEAVIGASQFLAVEDALAVLQAAVDNSPDDPYLRYALANRFQETSDLAGYQRTLNEWRESDPENAMPYYLESQMMMAQGDIDGAMLAMNTGTTLPGASTYASNSARYHAAALEASGYDRETARYLAASTAGSTEEAQYRSVSDGLMNRARELESQGQYEAAADLYDAVRVYGEQLLAGADIPQTQLVALQIQQDAVSAMMAFQEVWTPETMAALSTMATSVLTGITELTNVLSDLTNFLMSDDMRQVLDYTDAILSGNFDQLLNLGN